MLLEEVHDDIEDIGYHKAHNKGLQSSEHQEYKACQHREILAYYAHGNSQTCDKDIFFYFVFVHSQPIKRRTLQSYIMLLLMAAQQIEIGFKA